MAFFGIAERFDDSVCLLRHSAFGEYVLMDAVGGMLQQLSLPVILDPKNDFPCIFVCGQGCASN